MPRIPFIIPPTREFDFIASTGTTRQPSAIIVTAISLKRTSVASVLVLKIVRAVNFRPPQYREANGYKNTIFRKVLFHFSNNFWVFGNTQAAIAIGEVIANTGMMPARNNKVISPAINPSSNGTISIKTNIKATFGSAPAAADEAAFPTAIVPITSPTEESMSVTIVCQLSSLGFTLGAKSDMKSYSEFPRIFAISTTICIRKYDIFMAIAAIISLGIIFLIP